MARNSFVFVALIFWLFDFSFSENGCPVDLTCKATEEQCLTMENVALGRKAEISSFYDESGVSPPPACVVVNGNINNVYAGGGNVGNCAHTSTTDDKGWWQVHLGHNYTINNITVYSQDIGYRLSEVRVTIDGELCYDFPSQTSNDKLSYISCNTPLTGSTVRFEKRQRAADDAYYLVLCEVEIWVCRSGLYGPLCSDKCNCKSNDTCDNYYGTCPNGCHSGYYSTNCSQKCGYCSDATCQIDTGQCTAGCQNGWTGQYCTESCPDYYYGPNCANKCGHCLRNGTCNTTTGECHQGCDPGWISVFCNQMCPVGSYGHNCNSTCGSCESTNVSCDPVNGQCPNGCKAGYRPPTCDTNCTNNTYGKNCSLTCGSCASFPCDTVTGRCDQCRGNFSPPLCDECQIGWYGESCSLMCVNCAGSQSCHRVTGLCDAGCLAGWESPNCNSHLSSTEGTSTAIIIGVLVPFVVVLIVVAVVIFILRRIRRKRKQNTTSGLVELPVIPKECITPSQSQVVTKDTEDVSETLNNYDTLQTGTPEKSIYSALTSRECGSVTKEDPCYYNT